jgi:hypothetical protein
LLYPEIPASSEKANIPIFTMLRPKLILKPIWNKLDPQFPELKPKSFRKLNFFQLL